MLEFSFTFVFGISIFTKKTLASERSSAEFREEKLFQHLAEIHRGAINPYTDTPIETAADYKQYWKEYEEDRKKQPLPCRRPTK